MTPEQLVDLIQLALASDRRDLAVALAGGVTAPSPSTHEAELSPAAARQRRRRERLRHAESVTEGVTESVTYGATESVTTEVFPLTTTVTGPVTGSVTRSVTAPVTEEGERGRGDYRGVVGEGEIRVLADSGSTGSMLPMVPTGSSGHMLTRPAAVEAVKGKLVHMADARERRESKHRAEAELVFRYWQAKLGHTKAMFSRDREAKLVARLREGSTPDELCYAVDGIAKSPWHMGENPGAQRYDGIELLFRNRANVEKFASSQRGFRDGKPHPFVAEATEAVQAAVQQAAAATIGVSGGVAYA